MGIPQFVVRGDTLFVPPWEWQTRLPRTMHGMTRPPLKTRIVTASIMGVPVNIRRAHEWTFEWEPIGPFVGVAIELPTGDVIVLIGVGASDEETHDSVDVEFGLADPAGSGGVTEGASRSGMSMTVDAAQLLTHIFSLSKMAVQS